MAAVGSDVVEEMAPLSPLPFGRVTNVDRSHEMSPARRTVREHPDVHAVAASPLTEAEVNELLALSRATTRTNFHDAAACIVLDPSQPLPKRTGRVRVFQPALVCRVA